jgi:hypothetical protein
MGHHDDSMCPDCVEELRDHHDGAQAQTLRLFDEIDRTCDELRTLRAEVDRRVDRVLRRLKPLVGRTRTK